MYSVAEISRKISPARIIAYVLLLTMFFLPFSHSIEGLPSQPGLNILAKVKGKPSKTFKHERRFKLASIEVLEDQASSLHPSLLRVDYKQNLLVWPVVAGGITRSPPLTPSL